MASNTINLNTYKAKLLSNTYGANNSPIYFNAGVPTILGTIGSTSLPVWVDNGILKSITSYEGNAATATTWQTARTLTIGATGKSVNGSADVSWSMDDIMGSSTSAYFYRGDKTWSNTLTSDIIIGSKGTTTSPSSITYSNRITIVPYFHTGGPWYIKSGDDASNAYISLYYGSGSLYRIRHDGYIDGSIYIAQPSTSRRNGIIGTYDYTKAAAIWAMGSSYQIAADGSGLGSLYGAAYVYQGQGGTGGKTLAGGHQFVWAENGGIDVALGSNGVWIKKNGGIYWDPYVESASDASDVTSIYQIASGVAGGTELRINQQNDAADCINLCTNSYIYLNSKRAFTISDSWLRINEDKGFSSGIYTGSSLVRTDNQFQVGSGGTYFSATTGSVNSYVPVNIKSLNSARANLNLISVADVPNDFYLGANNASKWSITCRASSESYFLGFYSTTKSWVCTMAQDTGYVDFPYRASTPWLRVVNNSSNNSDDAMVYLENKSSADWAMKINCAGYDYGLYVGTNDNAGNAIQTNGNIRGHRLWANMGTTDERQVGVDNSTAGTLYLWSNTSEKGIYSGSGYRTGYIIRCTSSATTFYGDVTGSSGSCTGNAISANYIATYAANGGSNLACLQSVFDSIPKSVGTAIRLQHGSHSMALGWFLSGYGYANAYGGWLVSNYDDLSFCGVSNGTWRERHVWMAGDSVTNAVWNDLAECRTSSLREPGYAIAPSGARSTKRLEPGCRITSDTWGFALGDENDETKMPVAISGRVLAYPARPREEYHLGDCVCSAPDGKVDIMTREEIRNWPDCIIGMVNEIPDYDEWGSDEKDNTGRSKIKVNGRIWIDIK